MLSLANGEVRCTSSALTETIINAMHSATQSSTTTISTLSGGSSSTTATITGYTSWMAQATLTPGQSVNAYPVSGWNLLAAAAPTTCADNNNNNRSSSPAISTGGSAGLAVLAVWALGATVAAAVLGLQRLRLRKTRRRELLGEKMEAAVMPPGQRRGVGVEAREMMQVVGPPPSEMTEGRAQRTELPGS